MRLLSTSIKKGPNYRLSLHFCQETAQYVKQIRPILSGFIFKGVIFKSGDILVVISVTIFRQKILH